MKKIILAAATMALLVGFSSCNKAKNLHEDDKEMKDAAISTDGFSWYKNSDDILAKSEGSGHSYPYLRTRYNSTASSVLTADGKVEDGATFPEGSVIVKEFYLDDMSTLDRYAVMYKKASSENADDAGWLWAYVEADESIAYSSTEKGGSCMGCHNQTGAVDGTLMNLYFP